MEWQQGQTTAFDALMSQVLSTEAFESLFNDMRLLLHEHNLLMEKGSQVNRRIEKESPDPADRAESGSATRIHELEG